MSCIVRRRQVHGPFMAFRASRITRGTGTAFHGMMRIWRRRARAAAVVQTVSFGA